MSIPNPAWIYNEKNIALYLGYNSQFSNSQQQVFFVFDPNFNSNNAKSYIWDKRLLWFQSGKTTYTTWYVVFNSNSKKSQFETVTSQISYPNQVNEMYFYFKNVTNTATIFVNPALGNIPFYIPGVYNANFYWDTIIFINDSAYYNPPCAANSSDVANYFGNQLANGKFNIFRFYIVDNTINTKPGSYDNFVYRMYDNFKPVFIYSFQDDLGRSYNTNTSVDDIALTYTPISTSIKDYYFWMPNYPWRITTYTGLLWTYAAPNHKNKTTSPFVAASGTNLPEGKDDFWVTTDENPIGMTYDTSYIYVADNSTNIITRISIINGISDVWINTNLSGPFGLAIDSNRNFYVSNYGKFNTGTTSGTISKYTISDTGYPILVTSEWASDLNGPAALVCDSTYLYVTELGITENGIFTGTSIRQIPLTDPTKSVTFVSDLSGPIGLAIDDINDILYISNYNSNCISKIDIQKNIKYNPWLSINKPLGIDIDINLDTYLNRLFVTNVDDSGVYNISSISISDISITNSVSKEVGIFGILLYKDYMYVSNFQGNYITKLVYGYSIYTLVSNICFTKNTPILTDQGYIPIYKINPNIHTIRNKKIVDVTKTTSVDDYLVCFDKDSIAEGYPSEKTTMSKDHKLFYEGKMKKAYTFIDKFKNVYKVKYNGEILYNILMEEYTTIRANHLICETLDPKCLFAKLHTRQCKYSELDKHIIESLLTDSVKNKDYKRYKQITNNIK